MKENQKQPTVTIYTTPGCGFCDMAKDFFDDHAIKYTTKDISEDPEALEFVLNQVGQAVAPVISVDKEIVVGFDRPKLTQILKISK